MIDRSLVLREPERSPLDIDTGIAHEARVYDYLVGGSTHFAVDRRAAARSAEAVGGPAVARAAVRDNRAFLAAAVRHLVDAGVRQFLDIGTGIPGDGNVPAVARAAAPDARVVAVDNDPIVLALAHLLPDGPAGRTAYIDADLRDPEDILRRAAATLDLAQPIAVVLGAVLHHLGDGARPHALVGRLLAPLAPGSHLVVSHLGADLHPEATAALADTVPPDARYRLVPRRRADVGRFLSGLEVIGPGVVPVDGWRPPGGRTPTAAWHYGAVGRVG